MTMLDHDAVDEICDSEDDNDGDDVNDLHYGNTKLKTIPKTKKLQRSTKRRVENKL